MKGGSRRSEVVSVLLASVWRFTASGALNAPTLLVPVSDGPPSGFSMWIVHMPGGKGGSSRV